MKNLKKSLSVILVVSLILSIFAMCGVIAFAETYDNLYYKIEDCEIIITGHISPSEKVEIPAEIDGYPVTTIDNWALSYGGSLRIVTIPDSVTTIGSWSFYNCDHLLSVTIGNSVKTIGNNAFEWCASLKSIDLPESVEYIENGAFLDSGLEEISINNPECVIADDAKTIPTSAVIYGHIDSSAHKYAQKYDREFVSIDNDLFSIFIRFFRSFVDFIKLCYNYLLKMF